MRNENGREMSRNEILNEILRKVEIGTRKKVSIKKITKNNGCEYTGIVVTSKEASVAPVIYVDEYLEKVLNYEMTVEQASINIVEAYYENKDRAETFPDLKNKDFILDNVEYQLVNADMNEEMIKKVPHKKMLDLAVIYRLVVGKSTDSTESAVITSEMMKTVGISSEELEEAAMRNINRTEFPVRTMKEVLVSMGMPEEMFAGDKGPRMYVMTNSNSVNGAIVILRNDILNNLSETIGGDFYILPSSIHEVIAIPSEDLDESTNLKNMVRDVNNGEVQKDERLSYNVYVYNKEEGKLSIASIAE